MPIKVSSLIDLVANVTDVQVSAEWYQRVLGMERRDLDPGHGRQKRISLLFGNQKVNLLRSQQTRKNGSQPTTRKQAVRTSVF
jgi:hypothetical protein